MSIKFSTDKPTLVKNLIVVDGLTRTGKFFLGKLISGLNNIEYFQHSFILDYIHYMAGLHAITKDGFISLIRSVVDQSCYDRLIGRNLNLRYDDRSSVLNAPDYNKYILRSKSKFDRMEIVEQLSDVNHNFLFVLHDSLANANILFEAFPDLKLIHLIRHPIDLVYSWMAKDYGRIDINSNTELFKKAGVQPSIDGMNGPLPWYVHSFQSEYESLCQVDRVIASIQILIRLCGNTYRALSNDKKNKIMIVKYEHLVEETNSALNDISKFIGTKKSKYINEILIKEKCPNIIDVAKRDEKKKIITSKATKKYVDLLIDLEQKYERNGNYFSD